jgi:hypothetical protein
MPGRARPRAIAVGLHRRGRMRPPCASARSPCALPTTQARGASPAAPAQRPATNRRHAIVQAMSRYEHGRTHARSPGPMAPALRISPTSRRPPAQRGLTICHCGKSKPRNRRAAGVSTPSGPSGHDRRRRDSSWSAASSRPQRREFVATSAATALRTTPARTCVRILRWAPTAVLCCCTPGPRRSNYSSDLWS